jgi:hypothetical protein
MIDLVHPDAPVIESDAPEAEEAAIEVCTCGRARGAKVHYFGAVNGHPFEARPEATPRKRRRKGTSPTARTLAECRKRGWIAQNVEQFVRFPPPGHRLDLFGVIDIVAVVPADAVAAMSLRRTIGIQATASAAHHAHRRDKILAEPRAKAWVGAGNGLELWSWSKRGGAGTRKLWTLRVEVFTAESWRATL